MAKISGWVFLIIGILFSGLSLYLNSAQNSNSMTIFIYLGYLMIALGIAKILVKYVISKDKNAKNQKNHLPEQQPNTNKPYHSPYEGKKEISASNDEYQNKRHHRLNNTQNIPTNYNNQAPKQDMNGYIGYCSKCGTPMRRVNIFCHRCGTKQQ